MSDAIRIRARLRDGVAEALVLMPHPMETGMRLDPAGRLLPAHYITEVIASVGPRTVFAARMSYAVSRDPLITFRFRGAEAGQRLRVAWSDNLGGQRVDEAVIG